MIWSRWRTCRARFSRQDQEEPHAAHKQGDAGRLPKDGFRFVFQQDPGDGPGNDGDDEKEEQLTLRPVIAGGKDEGMAHFQPVLIEVAHQSARVPTCRRMSNLRPPAGDVEVVFQQGQMGGAGDGQKFADTLNDAE